jgi:hypothetical protein
MHNLQKNYISRETLYHINILIYLKWVPYYHGRHILGLLMEEQPPYNESSCGHTE